MLVNTDERKCLSSVHPSGVLTGVDQSSAPGNCGNNSYFEDWITIIVSCFFYSWINSETGKDLIYSLQLVILV